MTQENDTPNLPILPPTLVLIHIVAGITLNWIIPISISHGWGLLGLIFVGTAFILTKESKASFDKAKTNVAPNLPTTCIVTDGPFKRTRNPMYLSFMLAYIGISLMAGAPIMLLIGAHLFYYLHTRIIPAEEQYLMQKFGHPYLEYKEQVKRWL